MAKSKLTPVRKQKILNLVRAGNSRQCAAISAGITAACLSMWMRKGREQKSGRYVDFFNEVQKAEEEAEAWHVANIAKAAKNGTWQASAWWLERVKRERYGRWGPKPEKQKPQRLTDKEQEALKASTNALTVDDATAVWKRQLLLLEKAYMAGDIEAKTYFSGLHSLTQAATKMAELHLRGASDALPTVTVVLESNSPHIAQPRAEPVAITSTEHCGDLIEIS